MKNRYLHIDFQSDIQSDKKSISDRSDVTLDEFAILKAVYDDPSITQKDLAAQISVSDRTVKRKMKALQEKGALERVNGKRNGRWRVLIDMQL